MRNFYPLVNGKINRPIDVPEEKKEKIVEKRKDQTYVIELQSYPIWKEHPALQIVSSKELVWVITALIFKSHRK